KLAALCPDLKVVADSRALVENLVSACKEAMLPQPLKVLVEINVGQNRTGVEPGEEALQLAQFISQMPELKLVGLQGYEGHLQHLCPASERERLCREAMEKLTATTKLMRDHGLAPEIVTTGGTGTFLTCAAAEGVTEVQPGSFALMDTAYTDALAGAYENALTVMTTVLGVYRDRIVVDAGLKSLSTDMGFARPFKQLSAQGSEDGLPLAHLTYTPGGDEHGILKAGQDGTLPDLKPGDRLLLIPSHCDTTLNLYDTLYLSEPGQEVEAVPILARGKVQ
ncbi:MAG TPA: alanine racemase, partial [Candidatus Obscuribacter sp.]|nr:alanine racemase [Candidatus Obscuribacter sp.]